MDRPGSRRTDRPTTRRRCRSGCRCGPDTGHFDGAGVSNFDVIERFHDRILHVDLKDTIALGTYKTVNDGTGVTDVPGIARKVIEHNYTGYLLVEQAPPLNADTLEADLTRAREMFSPFVR